jgi:hypothetical protein
MDFTFTPPLPQYAFMAWRSAKIVQGQLYVLLLNLATHVLLIMNLAFTNDKQSDLTFK